jgi:hypothetical protein
LGEVEELLELLLAIIYCILSIGYCLLKEVIIEVPFGLSKRIGFSSVEEIIELLFTLVKLILHVVKDVFNCNFSVCLSFISINW